MFSYRCGGSEKPPDEEECDPPSGSESCNVPAWIVSDWSGCDGKCGELTIYFLSHSVLHTQLVLLICNLGIQLSLVQSKGSLGSAHSALSQTFQMSMPRRA